MRKLSAKVQDQREFMQTFFSVDAVNKSSAKQTIHLNYKASAEIQKVVRVSCRALKYFLTIKLR